MTVRVNVGFEGEVSLVKLAVDSVPVEPVITALTRDLRTLISAGPVVIEVADLATEGRHPTEQVVELLAGPLALAAAEHPFAVVSPSSDHGELIP